MHRTMWLLCVAVSFCVVACATPYHRKTSGDSTGGYDELRFDDGIYAVGFDGNNEASKSKVWAYWIYRCAELTREQGYELFRVATAQPKQHLGTLGLNSLFRFSSLHLNRNYRGRFIKTSTIPIVIPNRFVSWHAYGIVTMYHEPLPAKVPMAMRAQPILDRLEAYVNSSGMLVAPTRQQLLKISTVVNPDYHRSENSISDDLPLGPPDDFLDSYVMNLR